MSKPYRPPAGRIRCNRRSFEEVVRDLRYAVFAVVRHRPIGGSPFQSSALGSGFFVAPEIFLTCNHVINGVANPHQDGDHYQLVCSRDEAGGLCHTVQNVTLNQQVFLFPQADLALLTVRGIREQPFVALDYSSWPIGKEIGVAGYPIPRLMTVEGQLRYDALLFRVAKGVITSTYITNLQTDQAMVLERVSVIEVNFLFVPGNSGGPVFDGETGRVGGFVHGFTSTKIRERIEQVTFLSQLPAGIGSQYIENLNVLYSLAIKIERARPHLETFGVRL
jgi:S1-C subfamily serine protease